MEAQEPGSGFEQVRVPPAAAGAGHGRRRQELAQQGFQLAVVGLAELGGLSFAAALGLSVLLFEQVLGWQGQDAALFLQAFVFLVALGVDYNIFLMSRIREEAGRRGTRAGALEGLAVTGSVITSAGLVLAGTFAVLVTLPVVTIVELGLVVAVGILLDTLIVRSLLVPALAVDVGRAIWWPSRLARRTPDRPPDAAEVAPPRQDVREIGAPR